MFVSIGYSDNPGSAVAGRQAAVEALSKNTLQGPCSIILLFATARHDAGVLLTQIQAVFGPDVPVVGGGAVGVICNDRFGYAGDQVALAAFWLDDSGYELLVETGLDQGEERVGERLGSRLKELGIKENSPLVLFYDAIDVSNGAMRMVMATHLLRSMENSLGFLPDIVGAGLMGDYACTPTPQWTGQGTALHSALAVAFTGNVVMDHVIMHGCRPATSYYTVTRADGQTILEINGQPALDFLNSMLESAIPVESYPFFLILGVNRGDKWGEFDENSYANRLCLAIDKERGGIVMFEPDMVAGTEFQVMYRSLALDYMAPRIEEAFTRAKDRTPVFAMYIDCAGRAAGYGGVDMEDAVMVQKTIAGRVPLLGMYTGVEIARVETAPRGLDWTGVFCLFSIPK